MKSNTKTLITLAALGIGGYLLYKFFSGGQSFIGGGGYSGGGGCSGGGCTQGWLPDDKTPSTPMNQDNNAPTAAPVNNNYYCKPAPSNPAVSILKQGENIVDVFTQGGVGVVTNIGSTYRAPTTQVGAIVQAQQAGATVYQQNVASKPVYVAQPPTGNLVGLLTTGTPEQQITQAALAPKVVMINGVPRKVM